MKTILSILTICSFLILMNCFGNADTTTDNSFNANEFQSDLNEAFIPNDDMSMKRFTDIAKEAQIDDSTLKQIKKEIKTIHSTMQEQFEKDHDSVEWENIFLKESFDKENVKKKISEHFEKAHSIIKNLSPNIVKTINLITPEQKARLITVIENKITEKKTNKDEHKAKMKQKMEQFLKPLNFSQEQQTKLDILRNKIDQEFSVHSSSREDMIMKVLADYRNNLVDETYIQNHFLMVSQKGREMIDKMIDFGSEFHSILNSKQREQFVSKIKEIKKSMKDSKEHHEAFMNEIQD